MLLAFLTAMAALIDVAPQSRHQVAANNVVLAQRGLVARPIRPCCERPSAERPSLDHSIGERLGREGDFQRDRMREAREAVARSQADESALERRARAEELELAFVGHVKEKTSDATQAEVYIAIGASSLLVGTNFWSTQKGGRRFNVTPNRLGSGGTIREVLLALVGDVPSKQAWVESLMEHAVFNVHPSAIGADGRPPIDLSGVAHIRLSDKRGALETGKIETLPYGEPPPPLIERLVGCCFNGRPPGKRVEILRRLRSHRFTQANTRVLSMVVDTATNNYIARSALLAKAAVGMPPDSAWPSRLDAALGASRGGNLILIAHVLGPNVVVEDARGATLFSIRLSQLQAKARSASVKLILLGCETANLADSEGLNLGVIGKYNTRAAAERVEAALHAGQDGATFMTALTAKGIKVVVQPGEWSNDAAGASVLVRSPEESVHGRG